MISADAKLILHERTIELAVQLAPDNESIASTYQDFLDKYEGPISVDVQVVQDKDSEGNVAHPGHALIKLRLKDADDVEIQEEEEAPVSSVLEEFKASLKAKNVVKL